jgi:hypothetical protein
VVRADDHFAIRIGLVGGSRLLTATGDGHA